MLCILGSDDSVNVPGPFLVALMAGRAPLKLPAGLQTRPTLLDPSLMGALTSGGPSSRRRLLPVPRSMFPLVTEPDFRVTTSSPAPVLIAVPGKVMPFTILVAVILPALTMLSLPAPVPIPIAEAATEALQ